ncbi:peptidase [Streptomyces sp. NPDC002057]|uniref:peptidase n=1 Tax=Streptomyces sp. NPDC002057 TaxID=3154664 RepID=UPI0033217657
MKIRRILATAVAAAVTTPVLLLSAAPAFADTKPSPASTQKPASDEDDERPSLDELKAAVELAQKAYDKAVVAYDKAAKAFKAVDSADHPLQVAVADAKKAADAAAAAKTAADAELAKAEKALAELPVDATEEQKTTATAAVAAAKKTADEATAAKTAADAKHTEADTARDEALIAAAQLEELTKTVKETAAEKLAEAKEELEFFEEIGEECKEDKAVKVGLSGPKTITAGTSAVFSLQVTNTTERTLDAVEAYVGAAALPGEEDENGYFKQFITIEWTGAGNPHWTDVEASFDAVDVGTLAKGATADMKLRLTVSTKAPAGPGGAFAVGAYENNDGSCGIGKSYAEVDFDILAAKTDKPKPTPSETTATPTPAPTTGGNGNTTPQGGSSSTPVNGSLAATGANDHLNQIGLAAGAAVALGAGAMFVARRRKAGANV